MLVGTPIAGQLIAHGGYLALAMFTGATLAAGGLTVGLARMQVDKKLLKAV